MTIRKLIFAISLALSVALCFTACNGRSESENVEISENQPVDIKDVVDVEENTDSNEIASDNATASAEVIDFYATWCGPCKALAPMLEQLEKKYSGKIKFTRVDVDEQPDVAQKYNIEAMPTLVYLVNGKEVNRTVGLLDMPTLEQNLAQLVK